MSGNVFEYSCFISYRYGQGGQIREFIDQLKAALENRLGLLGINLGVFVDTERLKPSYSVNPGLAEAICKSLTMVVVYNSNYFDWNHRFCAKEFCAMLELEKARLRAEHIPKKHNLIIPVLLKYSDRSDIPSEILERNPCNLGHIFSNPEEYDKILARQKKYNRKGQWFPTPMELHPRSLEEIDKIAGIISDTYKILTPQGKELCADCGCFDFPGDDVIDELLKKTVRAPVYIFGKS